MNPLDDVRIGLTKQTYCLVLFRICEAVLPQEPPHPVCPFRDRKFLKRIVGLDVNLGFLGHVSAKVGSFVTHLCHMSEGNNL